MSELVNRINILKKRIVELEEQIFVERGRYVDEVDHSEQLAFCLASLLSGAVGDIHVVSQDVLREHSARRISDDLIPTLSFSDND
jgi:hypothetical protein